MTVFLTFARGWQTLAAVRSLGEKGIDVITSDSVKGASSYFSIYSRKHFIYKNFSNEEKFINSLIKNIKKYSESTDDILIPVFKDIYIISKHLDKFKELVKVPITNYENLQHVHDKWKLYLLAKKMGVRMPVTHRPRNKEELKKLIPKLKFPLMIKILDSAGGVGVKCVYNKDELLFQYKKIIEEHKEEPLIQEYIQGKDYCVTVLFNKGKLKAKMSYLSEKQFPEKTGPTILSKTVKEDEMEQMAFKICKKLNWHGVAEFDFRKEKNTGKPYLIECNPRFWASLNQSIKSHVDYPYLLYQIATTGDCESQLKPRVGIETEVYPGKIATEIHEVMKAKNKFLKVIKYLKHHRKIYEDIISLKDPLPVLGFIYPCYLLMKHGKIEVDNFINS
ncbi:MAG: ATP-grasp domain-containing protein [Nanoarchaeota archaeon]|nr:ATP-grasp domain-containing protein [Nanoarchaeota archaeon]MBU1855212.1 ATP-grasp domain-containing protein [Nanoarchaeota archaeon]